MTNELNNAGITEISEADLKSVQGGILGVLATYGIKAYNSFDASMFGSVAYSRQMDGMFTISDKL